MKSFEVRILGRLEVRRDGEEIELPTGQPRALFAYLVAVAPEVRNIDNIAEALWPDDVMPNALRRRGAIQALVSQLRSSLEPQLPGKDSRVLRTEIVRGTTAYRIDCETVAIDAVQFQARLRSARRAFADNDLTAARETSRNALDLWAGRAALQEYAAEEFAADPARLLDADRLRAIELVVKSDLATGRVPDSGDISELKQGIRAGLADDDIKTTIREAERSRERTPPRAEPHQADISEPLASDDAGFIASTRIRKMVTIVGVDFEPRAAGLDAEDFSLVLQNARQVAVALLEEQGALTDPGDHVVTGYFGLPRAHKDDPLRAVRAAISIRDRLSGNVGEGASLRVRLGINTGEVIADRDAVSTHAVAGEPALHARELYLAAGENEILIGDATATLVRHMVGVSSRETNALHGSGPVFSLDSDMRLALAFQQPAATPFVGRGTETSYLQWALARVLTEGACRVVTVLGPQGIGKTRLVREFCSSADSVTVLWTSCTERSQDDPLLHLNDLLDQLCAAREPEALIGSEPSGETQLRRIAALRGLAETTHDPVEQYFDAVRAVVAAAARIEPVLIVVDDIHFAGPELGKLVRYLGAQISDAPVLVVVLAWPSADAQGSVGRFVLPPLDLGPLTEPEISEMVRSLGHETDREEILDLLATRTDGNPLWIEHVSAVLLSSPDLAQVNVPRSLAPLVDARLDALTPAAQAVAAGASIAAFANPSGLVHGDAVAALHSDRDPSWTDANLRALLSDGILESQESEQAYRFRHTLLQDRARGRLARHERGGLHLAMAVWLESRCSGSAGAPTAQFELAQHLAEAFEALYPTPNLDKAGEELRQRAGEALAEVGLRLYALRARVPAIRLLDRALGFLAPEAPARIEALAAYARSLRSEGEIEQAIVVSDDAIALGQSTGNERLEWWARLLRVDAEAFVDPEERVHRTAAVAREAMAVFERLGEPRGIAEALFVLSRNDLFLGQWEETALKREQAIEYALAAGDLSAAERFRAGWLTALYQGPAHLNRCLEACNDVLGRGEGDATVRARSLCYAAAIHARLGDSKAARSLYAESMVLNADQGSAMWRAWSTLLLVSAASPTEPVIRDGDLEEAHDALRAMGDKTMFPIAAALLAESAVRSGDAARARSLVTDARVATAGTDVWCAVQWRLAHALVLHAFDARSDDAETAAREAVALAERTDATDLQATARRRLAEVLPRGKGREHELAVAEALCQRRGDLVGVRMARALGLGYEEQANA